jgi:hypothetical protein
MNRKAAPRKARSKPPNALHICVDACLVSRLRESITSWTSERCRALVLALFKDSLTLRRGRMSCWCGIMTCFLAGRTCRISPGRCAIASIRRASLSSAHCRGRHRPTGYILRVLERVYHAAFVSSCFFLSCSIGVDASLRKVVGTAARCESMYERDDPRQWNSAITYQRQAIPIPAWCGASAIQLGSMRQDAARQFVATYQNDLTWCRVSLVPKTPKTVRRSDLLCSSCESGRDFRGDNTRIVELNSFVRWEEKDK